MIEDDLKKATFGGGCFWCTEAIFQKLQGVVKVESGYSGGETENPTYEAVCSGSTGHAEVIQVTYQPAEISYEDLVAVHLLTHNPTTLNQQGADKGTQYRSIIFYENEEEQKAAQKLIGELEAKISKKVVTELAAFDKFYVAEDHHQDYYKSNPGAPYCQMVIQPKIDRFEEIFKQKSK